VNETSWDTVQRIDRSDPALDALRSRLYEDLTPAEYTDGRYAYLQQRKIVRYLEARNQIERIERAARAVAGFHTPGFQPEEVAA
jgi:hypothetical protein